MKIIGIYKIESKIHPDRIYIGSSSDITKRWMGHLRNLRGNRHGNRRLQNHINKYGINDLMFSILIGCEKEDLIKHEQFFIDSLNPWFNICKIAGNTIGIKHINPPWNKGLSKYNNDIIRKMAEAHGAKIKGKPSKRKGTHVSEESRIKMAISQTGKKDTEETKKKKSDSAKNKPEVKDITREKLRIANTGKKKPPMTEENHKNLSVAMQKWWNERKQIKVA